MAGFHVSEDKKRAEVKYQHLSYDDFDRSGNVSLWKLSKMFTHIRFLALNKSNFLDADEFMKDYTIFILIGKMEVNPLFYQVTRNVNVNVPVIASVELMGTGRSALTLRSVIRHAQDNTIFAQMVFKYVFVDKKTRRSKPPPDWFFERYRKEPDPEISSNLKFSFPKVTSDGGCHKYIRTVAASDTDFNGHLNSAEYIRYCLDAASHSCQKGHFRYVNGDVCQYTVTSMQFYYGQECKMDDQLTVCVWENKFTTILHFCIMKNDKIVFQANMTFTPRIKAKY